MKLILYIGNFSFPFGNASGKRVYNNGKLFRELGYEVVFIGVDKGVSSKSTLIETKKIYDGFTCYNFSYPKKNTDWLNYMRYFNKFKNLVISENLLEKLHTIIYYGSPTLSLFDKKIIKFSRRNNLIVLSDCVDWLITKTGNVPFDVIKNLDNTYQKAWLNKKVNGVITISSYLEEYYKRLNKETVVIPPLTNQIHENDLKGMPYHKSEKVVLAYAGSTFRKDKRIKSKMFLKDRIDKTILLLYLVKKNHFDFIFNIYGFTKEEYLKVFPEQNQHIAFLGDSVIFHGYLENSEVIKKLKMVDYTILLRDVNRVTSAGFPTKITESLSLGIPVITTRTSDLEKYIIDGKNGYLIDTQVNDENANKLIKILKTKNIDRYKHLELFNQFYYKNFTNSMKNFINKLDNL